MRLFIVLRYMGLMLMLNAALMLFSAGVSVYYGIDTGFYPLLLSFLLTVSLGALPLIFVPKGENPNTKEGYGIVLGSWLIACVVGAFPYLLWGGPFTLINAWFESASGYTTTGTSILNDVEALPHSLLFFRSLTLWIGGVGVVIFALLIIPSVGMSKMKLSSVEMSSIAKSNYNYRTQKILMILLVLYPGMTLVQGLLLKLAGMGWFDALNHAFSSVATGGFSTRNAGIAFFDSVWVEVIITFFTALAGLHFGLIFNTLTGNRNNIFRSEVARYYVLCILVGGLIVTLNLWLTDFYPSFLSALRYGFFHIVTIITTTAFATTDTSIWPPLSVFFLIFFTFHCACAGSTTGGIKADRFLLIFKAFKAQVLQRQHPNAVIRVKLNDITQDDSVVNTAVIFVVFYLLFIAMGTLLISMYGIDLATGFSIAFSCISNVGHGYGEVTSMDNYEALPGGVKFICTLLMLVGRLEIFGFIQLFFIKWWR